MAHGLAVLLTHQQFERHAGDVAEAAGANLPGHKHDALFDARSVALGIRTLVARGATNPFSQLP